MLSVMPTGNKIITIMHCGKYQGKDISVLPNWYLKWIAENWSENTQTNKQICKEADKEFSYRIKNKIWID